MELKWLKKGSGFLILRYFFVQIAIAFLFCNSPFMKKEEMEKTLKLCRKTTPDQALSRPAICLTAFMAKVRVRPMATPAIRQG